MHLSLLLIWFFLAAALPVLAWMVNIRARSMKFSALKISFISCVIIYSLLLALVFGYELYLDAKLDTFDLNNDGVFSGQELTEEQAIVMEAVVSDTGRRLAPITGAIATLIYFFFILIFSVVMSKMLGFKTNAT